MNIEVYQFGGPHFPSSEFISFTIELNDRSSTYQVHRYPSVDSILFLSDTRKFLSDTRDQSHYLLWFHSFHSTAIRFDLTVSAFQVHRYPSVDLISFQSWTRKFTNPASLTFFSDFISFVIGLDFTYSDLQVHQHLSMDLILFPSHSSKFTNPTDLIFPRCSLTLLLDSILLLWTFKFIDIFWWAWSCSSHIPRDLSYELNLFSQVH